jgi:flagellar motor switch protein FliM
MVNLLQTMRGGDMAENSHVATLRRMTRSHQPDTGVSPLTSSRAVRLALTKAANDAVGLILTVSSVAEETNALDDTLGALPEGLMLVGLHRDDVLVGLIAVDMQLRAAALEMQTMGALINQIAQDRKPTRTDKAMSDPFLSGFLAAFPDAVVGSPLEGWCDGITQLDAIADVRAAGLILADCPYRTVQMSVDLGVAERQGLLVVILPIVATPEIAGVPEVPDVNWAVEFRNKVNQVPATLTAQLHRFALPISAAQDLQVGQVLPLTGCTVHSVRLISANGRDVGQAKLGQSGGMRAIRMETAPPPDLDDLSTVRASHATNTLPDNQPAIGLATDLDIEAAFDLDEPLSIGDLP